ncbi:MAG: heme ABC exporter ATP-binding protein CcmA [Gemmatimonadota bacterium]|nr:heme ABC exporter ATP-binding protein CcmA [Gemmatimonadota bacterium]
MDRPNGSPAPVLEASGLVREYGPVVAVAGIDVSLVPGEFLTIFGPNGAGKSSLLGMLAGALRPTAGTVRIRGDAIDAGGTEWRRHVGVLSHRGFLYHQLTVHENLRFYGMLFGVPDLDHRIDARLRQVGLDRRAAVRVQALSHGMRQRLSLARALLHDPALVLLDEPYTGLDPSAAALLRDVLMELRDGHRTVVMVTHNLREGLELATRVAIQVGGRFAWEGSVEGLIRSDFERFYHEVVEERS